MKKFVSILCAVCLFSVSLPAQGVWEALKGAASSMKETFSSKVDLLGNWSYVGCAGGSDNTSVVAGIAEGALLAPIESRADDYLTKLGIKPGIATFHFTKDNTFVISSGVIKVKGKWAQKGNKVTLTFSSLFYYLKLDGVTRKTPSGVELLFPAEKFLTLADRLSKIYVKEKDRESVQKILDTVGKIDGLQLGFRIKRI